MTLKQNIYKHCLQLLEQKVTGLQSAINTAAESANSETKSSAGDKHETARAMMQLEQEKLGKQLKEALEKVAELKEINITPVSKQVIKGSLVETGKGFFFLSVGLGKLPIGSETVFAISAHSPLGSKLLGLRENEKTEVNGTSYFIKSIL
jgi:hypothetical protein